MIGASVLLNGRIVAAPTPTRTIVGTVTTYAGTGTAGSTNNTDLLQSSFSAPLGIWIDATNNMYILESNGHRIRRITSTGTISIFAGSTNSTAGTSNGTGTSATFSSPRYIIGSTGGNLYITENIDIRQCVISTVAVTTLAGDVGRIGAYANGTGTAARFTSPQGITLWNGELYVTDTHAVRKITTDGVVTTYAGATPNISTRNGYVDGSLTDARFSSPRGITVDNNGNFYIIDNGNLRIRKISSTGEVSTLAGDGVAGSTDGTGTAARFRTPMNNIVYNSADNNLYLTDGGNHTIRRISLTGEVTTIAGLAQTSGNSNGTGTTARFNGPYGIAVDSTGILYVTESSGHRIRRIV